MPYISKRRISPPNRTDNKEASERRNNKWGKYYGNKKYKNLRDWYMSTHVLCQDCLFNGRSVPATQLHHIIPFSQGKTEDERMYLLMDWEHNFVALCDECHDKRHGKLNHSKQMTI